MKNRIAKILRQQRKNNNFSAEDVANKLQDYNITISSKTIYGYETGFSQPNADMFVALCKIYGIKDINIFFDESEAEQSEPNPTFWKYNSLNSSGRRKADEYITDLSEQKKYTAADEEAAKFVRDIIQSAVKDSMQIKNNVNR